jgi:hypothetical protein
MENYHVKVNEEGRIFAGVLEDEKTWKESSDVTEEALEAVKEHLLAMIRKENKDISFCWNYNNGKSLILKLEEKDTSEIQNDEIKEENKEESTEEKGE